MSTCPEKDIHSIYLDNELPPAYVEEYEKHVQSCPKCQKIQAALKGIQGALRQDSRSMDFSQADLDAGFERLQARLSYSRVKKNVVTFRPQPFVAAAAGMAAAFAVAVFLPKQQLNATLTAAAVETQFKPISRAAFGLPTSASVSVDGELDSVSLASFFDSVAGSQVQTNAQFPIISDSIVPASYASSIDQNSEYNENEEAVQALMSVSKAAYEYAKAMSRLHSPLSSYDVFSPVTAQKDKPSGETTVFSANFINTETGNGN